MKNGVIFIIYIRIIDLHFILKHKLMNKLNFTTCPHTIIIFLSINEDFYNLYYKCNVNTDDH